VVKLVDAGDSKSPDESRAGSIPAPGTRLQKSYMEAASAPRPGGFFRLAGIRCIAEKSLGKFIPPACHGIQ
jgi:hypothetical protein